MVINQVSKEYGCTRMKAFAEEVRKLELQFKGLQLEHIPRGENFIADELSKIASGREPVPPGIFVERLSRPSIEAQYCPQYALCKESEGMLREGEAPEERPVLAAGPSWPVWAEEIWKYLHHQDLPNKDKSAE